MIRNEDMQHFIYWNMLKNHGTPFATWESGQDGVVVLSAIRLPERKR